MSILLVVADGSRARFLTAETGNSLLIEESDFVHSDSLRPGQEWTSSASNTGYGQHSMPHGDEARRQQEQVFASELCDEIDKVLKAANTGKIYLIAAPAFIAMLRYFMSKKSLQLIAGEIQKDLVSHSVDEIRSHLPAHL